MGGVCGRAALRAMLECDCVVVLPGSRASRGAMMEMRVALMVGIPGGGELDVAMSWGLKWMGFGLMVINI